jgi:lactate racemase
VSLEPAPDLATVIDRALAAPLDRDPLRETARGKEKVTIAFDDATVPCYAPVWAFGIGALIRELEAGGVDRGSIDLVCANALHRQFTHDELARLIGSELVAEFGSRLRCHDAEDRSRIVDLGLTSSDYKVELNSCVADSDLLIYLNCSTMRAFSGGWKSVCVGLATYASIHHHHTPDIMSMSLDRNRMHEMLDEMGAHVEASLGAERIFKVETVLADPLEVHNIYAGSVGATRAKVLDTLRAAQPPRRKLVAEKADVVIYGVPDWSPYAAFSHNNPILDLISTGLGYLGGVIQAMGKPGCTVILTTPCRNRWDAQHHPSYREVWDTVLPETRDPDEARRAFEPAFAARADYIDAYRNNFGFHPVHGIMALYPLKRLRHASRVIVAGPDDPAIPAHCGFDSAPDVATAVAMAEDVHGKDCSITLVEYPAAFNRQ